jgi:enoyl-CoA hydratase/carnithine racemase
MRAGAGTLVEQKKRGEMAEESVLIETPAPGVVLLRINRPEARNALNREVRAKLAEHFDRLGHDPEVRAIVLTGNQDAFAAGADIRDVADADAIDIMTRPTEYHWRSVAACPKPIVAAVNGYALGGGCELAMHCDIIVAGESASFGQPEVKIGIMPGAGGTQRLTRAVGKYKAMKMVLLGEPVSAREAESMGLVSELVPDAEVLDRAIALAKKISYLPPLAVRQIKEVLLAGQDSSLESALLLERKGFQLLFASEDQKEGMRAFLEKRRPVFKGR